MYKLRLPLSIFSTVRLHVAMLQQHKGKVPYKLTPCVLDDECGLGDRFLAEKIF